VHVGVLRRLTEDRSCRLLWLEGETSVKGVAPG